MLYYSVISHKTDNRYYVKIFTTQFHRIFFGSPKNSCVKVAVYTDDVDEERQFAELMAIGFDNDCSVEGRMVRGDGTKDMLNSAREFIRRQYDFVSSFTYKDASHMPCKYGTDVDMMFPSIAKYRTNWYSHYFGGSLVSRNGSDYLKLLNIFYDSPINISEDGLRQIIVDSVDKESVDNILATVLPIYNKFKTANKTYREFIASIYKTDCFYVSQWLDKLLRLENPLFIKLRRETWIMPISNTEYDITIQEIDETTYVQVGGSTKNFYLI
jgi:hypothetical protein